MKELILGGMRSGKSRLAEQRAGASGVKVTYIATATAGDAEMQKRIDTHRKRRPPEWRLIEEPRRLAHALIENAAANHCLVVDCLTLWLSNVLDDSQNMFDIERHAFLDVLPRLPGQVILVSNETGLGVVPLGELSRRFCDESGRLHQDVARVCDRVTFMVAGLPHILKGN